MWGSGCWFDDEFSEVGDSVVKEAGVMAGVVAEPGGGEGDGTAVAEFEELSDSGGDGSGLVRGGFGWHIVALSC